MYMACNINVMIVFVMNKVDTLANKPPTPMIFLFMNSETINKIMAMLKN